MRYLRGLNNIEMDVKDSICKALKALIELPDTLSRDLLIDFITGKESKEMNERGLNDLECYGIGDMNDDEFWSNLIDKAFEAGYIKNKPSKSDRIGITPAGKKYLKDPTPFEIEDEEDIDVSDVDMSIEGLVESALSEKRAEAIPTSKASPKTKNQIKLIQAIDRGIALDDYAQSEGMEFDEVLDDLSALINTGKKLNIGYFVDEVLGEEAYTELKEFFEQNTRSKDPVGSALAEFDDAYSEEEIRLAYIHYRCGK